METLFENNDFILKSTGHDYDFVGIIETKGDQPLTFFFSEELIPVLGDDEEYDEDEDYEFVPDESKTKLLGVHQGLKEYDYDTDDGYDEEEEEAECYRMANPDVESIDWFRTRDDKSTGFLSDCRERGQFLALIKAYCPEKLNSIEWA